MARTGLLAFLDRSFGILTAVNFEIVQIVTITVIIITVITRCLPKLNDHIIAYCQYERVRQLQQHPFQNLPIFIPVGYVLRIDFWSDRR